MTTTALIDFFKYNLWANLRLIDACADLTDTQLDATMKGTFGSVRKTLMHILSSEEGYVQRFIGSSLRLDERDLFPGFEELRRRAYKAGEELIVIAGQWESNQTLRLSYQEQVYDVPAILVLIQAINHAVDHRSQIATLLSQQDVTLPEIDGWAYYIELNQLDALS